MKVRRVAALKTAAAFHDYLAHIGVDLPFDEELLAGRPLRRKRICRTFSDCTTAPRSGLVSGCYSLDEFYKVRPEAETLAGIKQRRQSS